MSVCAQVPLPMNSSLVADTDKDQSIMIYKEVMNVKCLCLFSENCSTASLISLTSHVLILNSELPFVFSASLVVLVSSLLPIIPGLCCFPTVIVCLALIRFSPVSR